MHNTSLANHPIKLNIKKLTPIITTLSQLKDIQARADYLMQRPEVMHFLQDKPSINKFIESLDVEEKYILNSLIVLEQAQLVLHGLEQKEDRFVAFQELLDKLKPVERFYDSMGGLLGYHCTMLELILENTETVQNKETLSKYHYLKPPGYDIQQLDPLVKQSIKTSIEHLDQLAEIYPVGGAGDRLMLRDDATGEDLPSAQLVFDGYTLLEGLIRDLQAREYLHYKLFDKQIEIPVVMMTSEEKNNQMHIFSICEKNEWFGRSRASFSFVQQPLVPVLTNGGNWALSENYNFILKPGGHGVIWKLILDAGLFDELINKGKSKAVVRQINNPIAGVDYGIIAFTGIGLLKNKHFGFASCPRLLNTAEGMDVLIEQQKASEYAYCISNIEYTDFVKKQIQDVAEKPGSSYSAFPANTNILFIDLAAVKEAARLTPVPGKLINMKSRTTCVSHTGDKEDLLVGRLESLMQNLADTMVDEFPTQPKPLHPDQLHTFLTYNDRRKTISVTKKMYSPSINTIVETPDGAYYDKLANLHDLWRQCHVKLPAMPDELTFVTEGPSFIISHHPALGPLYEIIQQKIRGGVIHTGSELCLEIAELSMENVEIDGSLQILAENVTGHRNSENIQTLSGKVGRCILKDVKINNQGIDRQQSKPFWKRQTIRKESLKIVLKGESIFIAENVIFNQNMLIEVPDGYSMTAIQKDGTIEFIKKKIKSNEGFWTYTFDDESNIKLSF